MVGLIDNIFNHTMSETILKLKDPTGGSIFPEPDTYITYL